MGLKQITVGVSDEQHAEFTREADRYPGLTLERWMVKVAANHTTARRYWAAKGVRIPTPAGEPKTWQEEG